MDDETRSRIKKSVEKYITKNDPNRVKRKNSSPERDLQKRVIKHLNSIGWSVDCVDSKATFSQSQGRYISQSHAPGLADIIGNDSDGHSVYIEMKAPGRRNTLREAQREFLLKKIASNSFALVADSLEFILINHQVWRQACLPDQRKDFLTNLLPLEKPDKDDKNFLFD